MKLQNVIYSLIISSYCACSSIDESERLIYVKPATIKRSVLVEDFTGQRCVNCPEAAKEIENLQNQYGEGNVVAVAIHSGPLALYPSGQVTGLRTALGDDYYDYWHVEAEPSGLINRKGNIETKEKWASLVYSELQMEAPLQLGLNYEQRASGEIQVTVSASLAKAISGKLQLWLTEDSITAPQMMPDGTVNAEYVHHHVLRTALNGPWGEDVSWQAGEQPSISRTFVLEENWNVGQLAVVAFVYNQEGVQQVCRKKINE